MNAIIIKTTVATATINMTSVEVAFVRLCASIKANVKAKTNEKLGFEGKEEGIVAQAAVLIYRRPEDAQD